MPEDGIELLRRKRGAEEVTFDNVCDHLTDFVDRHPESAALIDDVATFLAGVEDVDHDHELDPRRGLR